MFISTAAERYLRGCVKRASDLRPSLKKRLILPKRAGLVSCRRSSQRCYWVSKRLYTPALNVMWAPIL